MKSSRLRFFRCPVKGIIFIFLIVFLCGCDEEQLKETVLQSRSVEYRTLICPFADGEEAVSAAEDSASGDSAVPGDTAVPGAFVGRLALSDVAADCGLLCYLLETAYAGYDDACAAGLDCAAAMQQVEAACALRSRNGTVGIADFASLLVRVLSPFIRDGHFSLYAESAVAGGDSASGGIYSARLSPRTALYYAPVFVKDGIVVQSGAADVAPGERYTGPAENLFPYPAAGPGVFRAGVLSAAPLTSAELAFEGCARNIRVCQEALSAAAAPSFVRIAESADGIYIACRSFQLPPAASAAYEEACAQLDSFVAAAASCRSRKHIVIDLRGNTGGNNLYPMQFFYRLYFSGLKGFHSPQELFRLAYYDQNLLGEGNYSIDSPATAQAWLAFTRLSGTPGEIAACEKQLHAQLQNPCVRRLTVDASSLHGFSLPPQKNFRGTIYLLIDRDTASAAENAVVFARHLFAADGRVVLVGENSSGCMVSGDALRYRLPASGITLVIPAKNFSCFARRDAAFRGEGRGFFPDYWSTAQDMPATLAALTGDGELAAAACP